MIILKWILLIIAAIISVLWSYECREKYYYSNDLNIATVSIVSAWWILLALSVLNLINPLHLIWLFPLAAVIIPILYYSIPGFRYPGFGFYLPFLLTKDIILFIITIIPPINDKIRQVSMSIMSDLIKCSQSILIEAKESKKMPYEIEELLREILKRYKNIEDEEINIIFQKSREYAGDSLEKISLWPICYYFIIEEMKKNKIEITLSVDKTIKKTIKFMIESWKENMLIYESFINR